MKIGLHSWKVYFDYKGERGYMLHSSKRVIAPTVEEAIAYARTLIEKPESVVTSVGHDGPVDGIVGEKTK